MSPKCANGEGQPMNLVCNLVDADKIVAMGYSIRTDSFRYTQWRKWLKDTKLADWSTQGLIAVELYDLRDYTSDSDPGNFENVNVAGNAEYAEIEEELRTKLVAHVTKSTYSNRQCTLIETPTLPPAFDRTCDSAINEASCAAMYAQRCQWFPGYKCQESTFCGFLTKDTVKKDNKGKTPHGLPVGTPGCSHFSSRCAWTNGKCHVKKIEMDK